MKERVYQSIFNAIEEINQQLPADKKLSPSKKMVLMGVGGRLDSLGLVNLVVATEEYIEDAFGQTINIADQAAMSETDNPFLSVATLANYIVKRLEQK